MTDERQTEATYIRLTPTDKAELSRIKAEQGKSMSEVMQWGIKHIAPKIDPTTKTHNFEYYLSDTSLTIRSLTNKQQLVLSLEEAEELTAALVVVYEEKLKEKE